MEKVTIVVPFYNVEAYIAECLTSLINQSYSNIEILCIDDCSPDDSRCIVKSYKHKDDRIKIITHENNKGLGGARNTGINNASGEYICFVDSDDYVSKTYIESLLNAINTNDSDIAICGFFCLEGSKLKKCHLDHNKVTITISENKNNVLSTVDKYRSATWFKMYKLELLKFNQIYQPEHHYYEDVLFWLKAAYFSNSISVIPDRLYYYRQRPKSIMSSLTTKHIDDRIYLLKNIDAFSKEKSLHEQKTDNTVDLLSYLSKHIQYGYTLIHEVDQSNLRLEQYYTNQIMSFSKDHDWPDFLPTYD